MNYPANIRYLFDQIWSFISGIMASILGYFLPIKNILHVVVFFFLLDVAFGYWKARKLRKEKFSGKIIWKTTFPRMLISFILVIASYIWDKEFGQTYVATYNLIGWFICGVLFLSIIQSAYLVTNWEMFPLLGKFIEGRVKEKMSITQNKNSYDTEDEIPGDPLHGHPGGA
jgi:multisubunit Na+/H+ antiporter MnhB subunit